jgi:predicted CXXCH cytochrome family protein
MAGHPDDPRVVAQPITAETCLGCHDEANSPDFDFAAYLQRATCQGGAPELGQTTP